MLNETDQSVDRHVTCDTGGHAATRRAPRRATHISLLRRRLRPGTWYLVAVVAIATALPLDAGRQGPQPTTPEQRSLVIVDRQGRTTTVARVPANLWGPRVSPDGTQLAFTLTGGTRADDNMYVGPLASPNEARAIGPGRNPHWSHDGARLFFSKAGTEILMWRRLDGDPGEPLATPARAPESLSPDGRILSYVVSLNDRFAGWTLDLATRTPTKIADPGPETLGTNISPDGRWIAYQSTSSGRHEVHVQPLGRAGPIVQVSRGGGFRPLWSRDMREMYFDDGQRQLWVVPIQTTPVFTAGTPVPLPIRGFVQTGVGRRMYDLLPDGRFVMVFP